MIVPLPDLAAAETLGRRIAAQLRAGDVIALTGPLGAGKTTLARTIIAACGHRGEVPSPTFTIIEIYPDCTPPIVHADFYRLEAKSDVEQLGLDEYREGAALIAEWPERIGGFAHEPACLAVALEVDGTGRRAIVQTGPAWQGRWI